MLTDAFPSDNRFSSSMSTCLMNSSLSISNTVTFIHSATASRIFSLMASIISAKGPASVVELK